MFWISPVGVCTLGALSNARHVPNSFPHPTELLGIRLDDHPLKVRRFPRIKRRNSPNRVMKSISFADEIASYA